MTKKVLIIGLDGASPQRVKHYMERGKMPTVKKMCEEGVWCENCLAPLPTNTPPSWTSIATGAWPGTHGVTCMTVHKVTDPLDKVSTGFTSKWSQAEFLWEAIERQGKKCILLCYPCSWPPTTPSVVQIGGTNQGIARGEEIDKDRLFTTRRHVFRASLIETKKARDWRGVSPQDEALEFTIELAQNQERRVTLWVLLLKEDNGYGSLKVCIDKDSSKMLFEVRRGEWSPWVTQSFYTDRGILPGTYRMKLLHLSPNGKELDLYSTYICLSDGWTQPNETARKLVEKLGPPLPMPAMEAYNWGWIDEETLLELLEYENSWYAQAAREMFSTYPWDIFMMHAHCTDYIGHRITLYNKSLKERSSQEVIESHERILEFAYESLDRMIGKILDGVTDADPLVVLVSDHGCAIHEGVPIPIGMEARPGYNILEDAGLLHYKMNHDGAKSTEIDWSKTKAVFQRYIYVYVNLKGRDPQGIVEPGEDYEKVRDQIVSALYDYTDPKTGLKPIALALRREDARETGLYGDTVGDVIYALRPEFEGTHSNKLLWNRRELGAGYALLLLKGPEVRKGVKLRRTVWLIDIVPTVCHLMKIKVPRDTEGAIIYQALQEYEGR